MVETSMNMILETEIVLECTKTDWRCKINSSFCETNEPSPTSVEKYQTLQNRTIYSRLVNL